MKSKGRRTTKKLSLVVELPPEQRLFIEDIEEQNKECFEEPDGWGEAHRMLHDKLLSLGGSAALMKFDEDVGKILKRGVIQHGRVVRFMLGDPSQCHANSASVWSRDRERFSIVTGWALSNDGIWRQHTWVYDSRDKKIVETTEKHALYFGVQLTDAESEAFADNNG